LEGLVELVVVVVVVVVVAVALAVVATRGEPEMLESIIGVVEAAETRVVMSVDVDS
jgi:hypothetical protein